MFKTIRSRRGKISWPLAVLGTLGIAGTAVVVPQMGFDGAKSKNSIVSVQSIDSGVYPSDLDSNPSSEPKGGSSSDISPPSAMVESQENESEPATGSLQDNPLETENSPSESIAASPIPRPAKQHLDDAIAGGSAPIIETDAQSNPVQRKLSDSNPVDYSKRTVFFATDRLEINPWSLLHWAKITMPAVAGLLVCGIMLLGLTRSKQRIVWGVGMAGGVILTAFFLHHAWIYAGQTLRIAERGGMIFGSRRYETENNYPLNLGLAEVSIPKIHKKGNVERPKLYKAEFSEDPNKHVMIQRWERADEESFFDQLRFKIGASPSQSAFVFIHGYNVTFEDAVLRTAQISYDLKYDGAAILYSWPSQGTLWGYSRDEANVAWSISHLDQFLRDIKDRTGIKEFHLVAHSMGNRALLGALERISLREPTKQPMFNQIVLAAPDVDAGEFKTTYAKAVDECSQQATLYCSATDRALLASLKVHGYARLGLTSGEPRVFPGVETVEVSPIDTSLLGHSYYGNHPLLIEDLRAIVGMSKPASSREWLVRYNPKATPTAWRFAPKVASIINQPSTR